MLKTINENNNNNNSVVVTPSADTEFRVDQ